MDEQPDPPAQEAAEVHLERRDDGFPAGDVGGRAQVTVLERFVERLPPGQVGDLAPGVQPGLHGDLGDPGQLVQAHHVPGDQDLGMAGNGQVLADHDPPGPVLLRAGGLGHRGGQRRRLHARGPQDVARLVPGQLAVVILDLQAVSVHVGDDRAHVQLDPQLAQVPGGQGGQLRAEHRQRRAPAVEQQDPGVLRLDVPVLAAQRLGRDLADLPGQFHAGRPGADQGEGEPAGPFGRVVGGLGHLERAEDPPPDLHRVLDGFHPGRDRGVFVVPEVGLPDAGGQDEVVVAELDLLAQRAAGQYPPPLRVDASHLGDDEFGVVVPLDQLAQRRGDLALGQDAGRALVQQRLEQVMLGPVDEGHLDRRARPAPGRRTNPRSRPPRSPRA